MVTRIVTSSVSIGSGSSVHLTEVDTFDITIAFKRPIRGSDVADGKLIQPTVRRIGSKRELCLKLDVEQADALYRLLRSYRKRNRYVLAMRQIMPLLMAHFSAIASRMTVANDRGFLRRRVA
jgi:hypothetical protein